MAGDPPKQPPAPSGANLGWSAIGYLLGGMLVWGGVGWLIDYWGGWRGHWAAMVGLLVGMAAGIYLMMKRLGT